VIQFPARKTAYLQSGGPHGTSIQYYWPDDPKPTGEYTKWQLKSSVDDMANAASNDALKMIKTASDSFMYKSCTLDPNTRQSLAGLLIQASTAWWKGRMIEASIEHASGREKQKRAQMARWAEAFTNYASAQLYSQMVTTKLK
jgi:hypothetical protein